MIYTVTNDFVKINQTQGTIQNTSRVFDIEVSDSPSHNSGIILFGLNKFSFNGTKYIRCIGGTAEVRVVPFATELSGGGSSVDDFDSQLDSILGGDNFADDTDMQNAIDDIFNGNSNPSSDPDIDSELDNIFNP